MPYNPGINDQTGLIFAQGLAQAGRGIGEGLAAMGARRDKEIEERKRDSDEFKALQALAKAAYGMDPSQTTAMGLPDLRGLVRGKEIERIEQERKQKQEYTGLQMEQLRQSMAAKQQAAAWAEGNVQALPGVMSSVRGRMQPLPMRDGGQAFQPRPMDLTQLAQIAQRQGYRVGSPQDLQALGEAAMPAQAPMVPAGFEPQEMKVNGTTYRKPVESSLWESLYPGQLVRLPDGSKGFATTKGSIQRIAPNEVAAELPNNPVMYGEDDAAFTAWLQMLPDEKLRKRAVEMRQDFINLTKKKELTPLEQAMMEALSPGWAKAQAAAAKQGTGGKGDEEEVWDWDPKKRGIKFK